MPGAATAALLGNRTGQQLRKDDWLVGQHLRQVDVPHYLALLQAAREAAVEKAAQDVGLSAELEPTKE